MFVDFKSLLEGHVSYFEIFFFLQNAETGICSGRLENVKYKIIENELMTYSISRYACLTGITVIFRYS